MLTQQMKVAGLRALIQAFIQFGGVFFATYAVADLEAALMAGGLAAFIALGYRGVGEGTYDSARDAGNVVTKADVGAAPPPADPPMYAEDLNDPSLGINRAKRGE